MEYLHPFTINLSQHVMHLNTFHTYIKHLGSVMMFEVTIARGLSPTVHFLCKVILQQSDLSRSPRPTFPIQITFSLTHQPNKVGHKVTIVINGPFCCPFKYGRKYMGNWGYFTVLIGVKTLVTGHPIWIDRKNTPRVHERSNRE